ncbi:hypothetical protein [Paenibacillus sinopodophylli]|nr:hypothetical protein [Paenibacillus sinopodophylli]
MRESTQADAQDCRAFASYSEPKADHFHEQQIRVTYTYELDRSEEGIA